MFARVDTIIIATPISAISLKVAKGVAVALMYADETWVPPDHGGCVIS